MSKAALKMCFSMRSVHQIKDKRKRKEEMRKCNVSHVMQCRAIQISCFLEGLGTRGWGGTGWVLSSIKRGGGFALTFCDHFLGGVNVHRQL